MVRRPRSTARGPGLWMDKGHRLSQAADWDWGVRGGPAGSAPLLARWLRLFLPSFSLRVAAVVKVMHWVSRKSSSFPEAAWMPPAASAQPAAPPARRAEYSGTFSGEGRLGERI